MTLIKGLQTLITKGNCTAFLQLHCILIVHDFTKHLGYQNQERRQNFYKL